MLTSLRRGLINFGIWILLSGGVVAVCLWDRVTEVQLSSKRLNRFQQIIADRAWFRSSNELITRRLSDGQIHVYSVPIPPEGKSPAYRTLSIDVPTPAAAAVDPEGAKVVWATSGKINVADFLGSFGTLSADLSGSGHVVAAPAGGMVLTFDSDGILRVFDSAKLRLEGEHKTQLKGADLIETAGSFVAVGNSATGEVAVFQVRASHLNIVEYRQFSTRLLTIAVSTSGRIAAATDRGTVLIGHAVPAPGPVRAIDFFEQDRFLAAGDFQGVHLFKSAAAPHQLVPSPAGATTVASSDSHVAVATPLGLEIHSYKYAVGISKRGTEILVVWAAMSLIFLLALMIKVFRQAWDRIREAWFWGRAGRAATGKDLVAEKCFVDLLEPPSDLIRALAESECIIVAGEDLSKPSGIPLWRSFVLGILEWAADLRYIDDAETEQSREAHKQGQFDKVAEALIRRFAGQPELMHGYARSMYLKPAPLSNVHETLGEIPFAGAITPNLDTLLERALAMRQDDLFHSGEVAEISARVSEKRRFILKIRGHWEQPESIVLVPSRAFASCAGTPEYAQMVTFLLTARTLLFVGMSLDDIRTMVSPAILEKAPERRHFAIVPKSEVPRRGVDAALKGRGVFGLVYPDGETQRICDFLEKLAAARESSLSGAERA